jgi:hypothetical protein
MRVIATVLACLFLASVSNGSAQAAPPSAVVLPKKATVLADGSVQITMRVRCTRQQQAFEWSVEIRQGAVFGNDSAGPVADLVTCDGQFHTVGAVVPGANGPYTPGRADVQALVQLFDAGEGSDVELEDRAVVQLRP